MCRFSQLIHHDKFKLYKTSSISTFWKWWGGSLINLSHQKLSFFFNFLHNLAILSRFSVKNNDSFCFCKQLSFSSAIISPKLSYELGTIKLKTNKHYNSNNNTRKILYVIMWYLILSVGRKITDYPFSLVSHFNVIIWLIEKMPKLLFFFFQLSNLWSHTRKKDLSFGGISFFLLLFNIRKVYD